MARREIRVQDHQKFRTGLGEGVAQIAGLFCARASPVGGYSKIPTPRPNRESRPKACRHRRPVVQNVGPGVAGYVSIRPSTAVHVLRSSSIRSPQMGR